MSDIHIQLPTLAELTESVELAWKNDQLNLLLSQNPPVKYVKDHPFIKQDSTDEQGNKTKVPYKYLPIDKVEHLLRKIFKEFRIEITGQGTAFNGVWVSVRIHFKSPTTDLWSFHDGIGASQLQTKSGSSPADLQNINNGALSMAFPLAKTLAVKDACDHFGSLFGANLNRRDVVQFEPDKNLAPSDPLPDGLDIVISEADSENIDAIWNANPELHKHPEFNRLLQKRQNQLANVNSSM